MPFLDCVQGDCTEDTGFTDKYIRRLLDGIGCNTLHVNDSALISYY